LGSGIFEPFIGVAESQALEFKREPHCLDNEGQRFELAKDGGRPRERGRPPRHHLAGRSVRSGRDLPQAEGGLTRRAQRGVAREAGWESFSA
jgi:hypothetical protein